MSRDYNNILCTVCTYICYKGTITILLCTGHKENTVFVSRAKYNIAETRMAAINSHRVCVAKAVSGTVIIYSDITLLL